MSKCPKESSCEKRDREFLERVIKEREKLHRERIKALGKLIDERDKQYEARFKAQEVAIANALAAQEKSVSAAFAASEKAIVKSEVSQKDYNERSNEFRGQLDDQAKTLMPRTESLNMHAATSEKIATMQGAFDGKLETFKAAIEKQNEGLDGQIRVLREDLSKRGGQDIARKESTDKNQWSIGTILAILAIAIALAGLLLRSSSPVPSTADPRVVYVPVPAGTSQPTPALVPAPAK